jgi:hypothetical protein
MRTPGDFSTNIRVALQHRYTTKTISDRAADKNECTILSFNLFDYHMLLFTVVSLIPISFLYQVGLYQGDYILKASQHCCSFSKKYNHLMQIQMR